MFFRANLMCCNAFNCDRQSERAELSARSLRKYKEWSEAARLFQHVADSLNRRSVEEQTALPLKRGVILFQVSHTRADTAAAGSGERDEFFVLQLVGFDEGGDNARVGIPPYREADENGIVFFHVFNFSDYCRT